MRSLTLALALAVSGSAFAASPEVKSTTPCVTVDLKPKKVQRAMFNGNAPVQQRKDYYFKQAHDLRQHAKTARAHAKHYREMASALEHSAGADDGLADQQDAMARGQH